MSDFINVSDYGAVDDGTVCQCGERRVAIEGDIAICFGCGRIRGVVADPFGQRDATSAFQMAIDHGLPVLQDRRNG